MFYEIVFSTGSDPFSSVPVGPGSPTISYWDFLYLCQPLLRFSKVCSWGWTPFPNRGFPPQQQFPFSGLFFQGSFVKKICVLTRSVHLRRLGPFLYPPFRYSACAGPVVEGVWNKPFFALFVCVVLWSSVEWFHI